MRSRSRLLTDSMLVSSDFATSTDLPMPSEYDGDGKASNPVMPCAAVADFNGDESTDVSVVRQSEGRWYVHRSGDSGLTLTDWGLSTDVQLALPYAIRKVFFP